MNAIYQGSCLCGAVRYEVHGEPKAVSHCHCGQCRKSHGAAFATYGSVPREALRVVAGRAQLKGFASSATVLRQFCAECGSSLFWSRSCGEFSGWVSVALATLDTPFVPTKARQVHEESRLLWPGI